MKTNRLLAMMLVIVLIYAAITLYGDVAKLRLLLSHFAWSSFALSLALALGNYALRFLKWQYYLRRLGVRHVPWGESLVIFLSGFVMSVTPAKAGEVFKSALLEERHGVPVARSAPIVVADRLTDLVSLIAIVAVGGFYFPGGRGPAVAASLLVSTLLAFVFSERLGELVLGVMARLPVTAKIVPRAREAYGALRVLAGPSALLFPTALSLVAWGLECLALYLIVGGLGSHASLPVSCFVYATATVAGAVAMLPGGVGGTEMMMISLLQSLTEGAVTQDVASAATLLVRLATLWFAVGVGGLALVYFRARMKGPRAASSTDRGAA
ncbi:MAG: flippase-like domain-containing protein [Myxococcales bacterium]|nr:flippase-like domain-containing protein [Myxococcales bacterium]